MKDDKTIWVATVGSHMWGMNHPGSDMDLFEVYIHDTRKVLAGHRKLGGVEVKYDDVDLVKHEIGHVVTQLQKGNINFLWSVMSPIIEYPKEDLGCEWNHKAANMHSYLRFVIKGNLSKNYIHSITGLVRANLSKYFGIKVKNYNGTIVFDEVGEPKIVPTDYKYHKKIKLMFRTLMQGYLLLNSKIEFPNVDEYEPDLELLETLYKDTIQKYDWSELPEKPNPEAFDDFLVKTRLLVLDYFP